MTRAPGGVIATARASDVAAFRKRKAARFPRERCALRARGERVAASATPRASRAPILGLCDSNRSLTSRVISSPTPALRARVAREISPAAWGTRPPRGGVTKRGRVAPRAALTSVGTVAGNVLAAVAVATMGPSPAAVATVAAATTATAGAAATGGGFFGYFFAFLLGGAFFSTFLGVAAIFMSVGGENVRRAWRVFQFLSSRVWKLVAATAVAVKASIEKKAGWDDTKKVLDEGLAATKREVDESLKAFNQERDFYAAAVGIPGLRTAQYVLDHMMPGLFAQKLEASLANSIGNMKHKNMKRMILKRVNAGKSAPLLTGARFYDVGEETMAFDLDMKWSSDVTADMEVVPAMGLPGDLAKVPVQMHNVGFDGTVRVMLAKLQRNEPGYGAIVVSFPDPPSISLDIKLVGGLEVNRVPWLRNVVSDATKTWIKEEMLWPQRMIIPAEKPSQLWKNSSAPEYVLSKPDLQTVLDEDPLMAAEANLTSLQEIATFASGKVAQLESTTDEGDGVGGEDVEGVGDGGAPAPTAKPERKLIDVEVTDADTVRPTTPQPTAREEVWNWIKGASKVTADKTVEVGKFTVTKTVEVSKVAVDKSKEVAASDETKKLLNDVGGWWNTGVGGWFNNVASRAAKGKAANSFPPAEAWTMAAPTDGEGEVTDVEATVVEDAEKSGAGGLNGAADPDASATKKTAAPKPR